MNIRTLASAAILVVATSASTLAISSYIAKHTAPTEPLTMKVYMCGYEIVDVSFDEFPSTQRGYPTCELMYVGELGLADLTLEEQEKALEAIYDSYDQDLLERYESIVIKRQQMKKEQEK